MSSFNVYCTDELLDFRHVAPANGLSGIGGEAFVARWFVHLPFVGSFKPTL